MQYVIGVDIGTQGTKVVLFTESGQAKASAFHASCLLRPVPGEVEEDPEFQFDTVCRGIAECVAKSGVASSSIAALAIGGQMAGVIGIDAEGRHVTPYDSWLDTRCAKYIKKMEAEAGLEVIRKSGGPPSFNHGPKILWWMHERPEVFKRIASFVQPGGYAAMRLCHLKGRDAFIDSSYLHFSGFADNPNDRWDAGLCKTFGVELPKLPRIVKPEARIGAVEEAVAARCGLLAGTPVMAGCGDTAASFLAAGATEAGICVDVAGTASVFASTTSAYRSDTKHGTLSWGRSATPGLWHPYAYVSGGGMNLEWFRKLLVSHLGADAQPPSLRALDQCAAALPADAELPLFVPHLSGRVNPSQPHLRGAWVGLNGSHAAAHLYLAVLEAVALEYGIYRDILHELNPELRIVELRITGGGEKSAVWNQLKADILGAPIVQLAGSGATPCGAAMLAALGVGLIKDLHKAAATWVETGPITKCRPERHEHCARRLARYKSLLETLANWSDS